MNRKQRRDAASQNRTTSQDGPSARPPERVAHPPANPSLVLRAVAKVILSPWVLRRVHHRVVRASLAVVAREVGRYDLAAELETSN